MDEARVFKPYGFNRDKLLHLMEEQGLAGILLTSPENVYYTTCYTVLPSSGNPILYSLKSRLPFFVYLSEQGKITLLCWGFSTEGVEFGADEIKSFSSYEGALETLPAHLRSELSGGGRLGIEASCPYYVLELIRTQTSIKDLQLVDDLMARLRLVKSEQEIGLLRKSTQIIETTLAELYDVIHVGMSRLDLMREARYRLFKNGATGISHLTFSFGQANPEIAISERLGGNQLVTLDLGGIYQGYASDNRRYVFTGQLPDPLLERYQTMVDIVDGVAAKLVPGASYADIFQRGLELFARHGLAGQAAFNHVGHNIGLETEEQWITDDPALSIQAGMVINIELYSRAPTGHHIGNEETYIIRPTGPERVSLLPREIRTL